LRKLFKYLKTEKETSALTLNYCYLHRIGFMNIVLASASPRRAQLFKQLNFRFSISPSSADENSVKSSAPPELVQKLAKIKGEDVAKKHPGSFIIAADTIVWFRKKTLGKPNNEPEAKEMLRMLSNQTHEVYTGVFIAVTDARGEIIDDFTFEQRTKVTFSALTDHEINYYISTGSPFDKAGAYGIQDDFGSLFVEKIEGDYYNVVGFPLNKFYQQLKLNMPKIHQKIFFNAS
jgi:septum formation protein